MLETLGDVATGTPREGARVWRLGCSPQGQGGLTAEGARRLHYIPRDEHVLYRACLENTRESQDILPAYQLFFIFLIKFFLGENVFLKSLSCNVFINSK